MSEYEEHSGDAIKCPYCGHVNTDSWEWDEECTYECERCLMSSDLRVETFVTYTTTPSAELLEDQLEDLERRISEGEPWDDKYIVGLKAALAKMGVS